MSNDIEAGDKCLYTGGDLYCGHKAHAQECVVNEVFMPGECLVAPGLVNRKTLYGIDVKCVPCGKALLVPRRSLIKLHGDEDTQTIKEADELTA